MILNIVAIFVTIVSVVLFLFRKKIDAVIVKNNRRKQQKKQLIKMSEEQKKTIKGLKDLSIFIDWLNKQFVNRKQRKQFWHDFMDKKYRQTWFEKLFHQMESKNKILETQIEKLNSSKIKSSEKKVK